MDKLKIKSEIEELVQAKHLLEIRLKILRYKLKYEEDPRKEM